MQQWCTKYAWLASNDHQGTVLRVSTFSEHFYTNFNLYSIFCNVTAVSDEQKLKYRYFEQNRTLMITQPYYAYQIWPTALQHTPPLVWSSSLPNVPIPTGSPCICWLSPLQWLSSPIVSSMGIPCLGCSLLAIPTLSGWMSTNSPKKQKQKVTILSRVPNRWWL